MRRSQLSSDDRNTQALLDEYCTLVDADMADFLRLYLVSLRRDIELGLTCGEPERAAQAEQDIVQVVADVRDRIELCKKRFAA
ncbi:MAG: hypothetical protein AVDCRST_MAG86-3566 [uncultured Truepera sp.]|uniref:Uncharacterized protein n=1 Tax=uncultured Truepera sp. TaxID=543023 RepID=A0A6J4VXI4_9DEIN|nr:MAG: hypothetical protein AVDCRST_MAG86-3566 [uncultured Truepera sp.]